MTLEPERHQGREVEKIRGTRFISEVIPNAESFVRLAPNVHPSWLALQTYSTSGSQLLSRTSINQGQ
ncbi:hypothetical protein K523DRAFT_130488 [Schizophyllum commune Tattone D]|nr:hypothetical protein K523DRAFT_130488 [Schizophyllum commune Tattone D]